ncbi:MAG: NAD-binding protein, partial [Candidatus Tectomicrobia bacterium]|nr:NAD-binding protein [Candidatus Tectomicrobia bacterium]
MRVVIVGCGRVGSELANALSVERHEVVVIDRNPLSFGRLSRDFSGRMLTGIGFDRDVLQKAEIEGAEAL